MRGPFRLDVAGDDQDRVVGRVEAAIEADGVVAVSCSISCRQPITGLP